MDHSAMAGMNHAGMDHGTAARGTDALHAYEATLTSRTTDTILFYSMSAAGVLSLVGTAPAGDGPWHAHVAHDGRTMLIPDRNGNTVTVLDAVTKATVRTVSGGPLSQPHSPAPDHAGQRFYVTSSNLNGAWTAPYLFLGPATANGTRTPLAPAAFSNVAAFTMDGTLVETVQLGAYASGLEPFMVGVGGHESM